MTLKAWQRNSSVRTPGFPRLHLQTFLLLPLFFFFFFFSLPLSPSPGSFTPVTLVIRLLSNHVQTYASGAQAVSCAGAADHCQSVEKRRQCADRTRFSQSPFSRLCSPFTGPRLGNGEEHKQTPAVYFESLPTGTGDRWIVR